MTEKTRKILLSIFLSLLIVSLMSFSLTWARYSEEMPSGGNYSGNLEYVVSDQIEISSAEDFFTAIENGYTNIKISDETDNPLVVTGGVSDVNSDLTIDLNGHELQRNNREPMLNITEGVRLTVIDSSQEKSGCFYNPVGDVLQISGGTLTVTGGIFESGPRNGKSLGDSNNEALYKSEYATKNGSGWKTDSGATIKESKSVKYYEKNNDNTYSEAPTSQMPILIPNVTAKVIDGKYRYSVNGNMYFGSQSTPSTNIDSDTYLYFTIDEEDVDNNRIAATNGSADFYYTYHMKMAGEGNDASYSYVADSSAEAEGAALVTVYGYNKVKSSSGNNGGIGYAAIRMNSGNLYVRGGSYSSYFGTESTSCVYASGGYMAVEAGTFEAQSEAACVDVNYGSQTVKDDDDRLKVDSGSFYSEKGDTIRVQNGVMAVTGGNFNKTAPSDSADEAGDNNAIISISGGTLTVDGARQRVKFSLKGSYMYGIESLNSDNGDSGTVTVTNADFNFNQGGGTSHTSNYAIYSAAGEVTVEGCVFTLPGKESRGISIEAGTVNVDGTGGTENLGKDALDTSKYSYFYLDQAVGCYGVYAAGSAQSTINMKAAQIFVGQDATDLGTSSSQVSGAGIYMNSTSSDSKLLLGNTLVIATGNSVSGIYVDGGAISQVPEKKLVVITGAQVVDYTAGETHFRDISSYGFDTDLVKDNRIGADGIKYTYGVYSSKGEIELENLYTAVYGDYAAGLLTMGGNITVNESVAIRVVGTESDLSSSGISTENGKITLKSGGNIYVEYGLGLTARNGSIAFEGSAAESGPNQLVLETPQSTAIYVSGGDVSFGSEENARIEAMIESKAHENLPWVKPPETSGGTVAENANQSDGIYVQGGSLSAYGELNVTHTGLDNESNQDDDDTGELYRTFKTKSFAVRIESTAEKTAEVTIVKGTITNSRGGGVYVSGSDEGEVLLGNQNSETDTVSVRTTGTGMYENNYFNGTSKGRDNWKYLMSKSGGPAIEVKGGSLIVHNGSFTAAQGDGLRVTGGESVIYGGTFIGADVYRSPNGATLAGPGASYSFKMYGGEAKIYGGTFGSNSEDAVGSGAFIMGTSQSDEGVAKIYGGSFNVGGQAGFSIYNYAAVTFDPGAENNKNDSIAGKGGDISVSGVAAGIAVEDLATESALITIYGGAFSSIRKEGDGSDGSGIWYGNHLADLEISGGEFTGSLVSGLCIYNKPTKGSIQLSGGTYTAGKKSAISYDQGYDCYYSNILANGVTATATFSSGPAREYTRASVISINDGSHQVVIEKSN